MSLSLFFLIGSSPGGSDGKLSACNAGDLGSIPRSERSPGEGNGNPLHTHNEILLSLNKQVNSMHAATRMDPEDILLSEINQTQKGKYCIVLFI